MLTTISRACAVVLFIIGSQGFAATDTFYVAPFPPDVSGTLISIKGSNTVGAALAPAWAERYLALKGAQNVRILAGAEENEYQVVGMNGALPVAIQIHAHGTGTGFAGLRDGSTQIAIASRQIKAEENQAVDAKLDLRALDTEFVVALDGLAIVVHPDNPIQRLTRQQVADIFSGKIQSWEKVGGFPAAIRRFARDDKSGTWDTFKSLVLGSQTLAEGTRRFESNDRIAELVAGDINAIGFVGLASVNKARALAIADSGGRALPPAQLYVATEDYALSRRLYMYTTPQAMHAHAREFLAFVQSPAAQKIVELVGFVSLEPVSVITEANNAPDHYTRITREGERLSINFAFNANSATLDNKAQRDIARLAEFMRRDNNRNKIIQLIGFGDERDSETRTLILSKLRALAVKMALREYNVDTESVIGLGSDLAIADTRGQARSKNQRVEVWLYEAEQKMALTEAKKDASLRQESTTPVVLSDSL